MERLTYRRDVETEQAASDDGDGGDNVDITDRHDYESSLLIKSEDSGKSRWGEEYIGRYEGMGGRRVGY